MDVAGSLYSPFDLYSTSTPRRSAHDFFVENLFLYARPFAERALSIHRYVFCTLRHLHISDPAIKFQVIPRNTYNRPAGCRRLIRPEQYVFTSYTVYDHIPQRST